ncbi:MAG: hypothetical protein OEV59_01615 [Deltaproteobacteria bacterium]|nr:hypothetical protein [Deltaproteobacteria bacterium]
MNGLPGKLEKLFGIAAMTIVILLFGLMIDLFMGLPVTKAAIKTSNIWLLIPGYLLLIAFWIGGEAAAGLFLKKEEKENTKTEPIKFSAARIPVLLAKAAVILPVYCLLLYIMWQIFKALGIDVF